jgi:hypothetical protein
MGGCEDEECLFYVADEVADFDRIGPSPCDDCREVVRAVRPVDRWDWLERVDNATDEQLKTLDY